MKRSRIAHITISALALLLATSCERDTSGLQPASLSSDPIVFDDAFGQGVEYQAFLNTNFDAVDTDNAEKYRGTASLKVTVPGPISPAAWFTGGAITTKAPRDLTSYNAVIFYAKASEAMTLDVAGFANDNTGTSRYEASTHDIELTTSWQKFIIPIPLPAKLEAERGLFFFAEGFENDSGYTIWFDDIMFASVPNIGPARPALLPKSVNTFVGAAVDLNESTQDTFKVAVDDLVESDLIVDHLPGYFTFTSSNDEVVTDVSGVVRVVGAGVAMLTASLAEVPATGEITVSSIEPPPAPAPVPPHPESDVISLFSDKYASVPVYTWLAFGSATVSDLKIQGNNIKAYTGLTFAGIQLKPPPPEPPPAEPTPQIDATDMTHFSIDVWVPKALAVRVKLVDFGADGRFQGTGANADSEHELTFSEFSTPQMLNQQWSRLDVPLSDFIGLTSRAHIAQVIVSIVVDTGDERTVFLDNIYFHK